jgi:hypothetical protein
MEHKIFVLVVVLVLVLDNSSRNEPRTFESLSLYGSKLLMPAPGGADDVIQIGIYGIPA